jgi:hypothetical protein
VLGSGEPQTVARPPHEGLGEMLDIDQHGHDPAPR